MASSHKLPAEWKRRMPALVERCIGVLEQEGGRCWVVGGAVRDVLLGAPVRDWDLATTVLPDRLVELFPEAETRDRRLGAVRLRGEDGAVVVTTLREEGDYRDHRHPDRVRFVEEPELDAARRDFTVNALYAEPGSGELLDPTGGLADLQARSLRAVGDPDRRFEEDALRILRAVRFCARLDFEFDAATGEALTRAVPLLAHLSMERVYEELTRAFTGPGRGRALRLLVRHGLAAMVIPEVTALEGVPQPPEFHPEGDVLTHVCLVLDHAEEGDPVQAWCAVLHDVGKPATFTRGPDRIRFDGHDILSARMADEVLRRLRAPRALRETVVEVCRDHIRFATLQAMRPSRRERWLRSERFPAHLAFHRADCLGSHGQLSLYETALRQWRELPPEPPPLPVTGQDVLALGVPEGPMVGELLSALRELLEEGAEATRERALAELQRLVSARVKPDGRGDDKPPGQSPGENQ